MFNREDYLEKLKTREKDGLIKVITGLRRTGKTFLLNVIFNNYLIDKGIREDHIIKFAFDSISDIYLIDDTPTDASGKSKKVDARKFLSFIENRNWDNETYYLLLDEIQNLESFEAVLNSLLRKNNVDIYVTGSNSRFLSKDIMTEFKGRGEEIHLFPLTFREYCEGLDLSPSAAWKDYIETGGIPLIAEMKDPEQRENYLSSLCSEVYLTDVVARNGIKDETVISELFDVVASMMASVTNPTKITNTFITERKKKTTDDTVTKYLGLLEDAFLLNRVKRFDVEGRRYINASYKFYFEDIGIRNARLGFRQINDTHIMENIVYNELRVRGYNVDIGVVEASYKTDRFDKNGKPIYSKKQYEVDFVASRGAEKIYIQSAYSIPDEEKEKQEKASLLRITDSFRKVIIVRDDIKKRIDDSGIVTMNVFDFLLDKDSLR